METYLVLNLFFLTLAIITLRIMRPSKAQLITMIIILAITAIGDTIIIALGIVGYDTSKLLGVFIGRAPIEDFFYAVVAALIVPTIWHKLEKNDG
jgi:lycopene cyclase domain-containing protein